MFITISSELVRDLDAQLNRLGAVAAVWHTDTPALVAIGQGFPYPVHLNHPNLSSFVEAELIAARLNALQGVGDRQRIAILRSMTGAGSH
ncbi:hypothetical protein IMW75_20005 [Pseudomonas gregormendelii]|uniref:Uncharacterized protein n=1 Tax=Pseudomonas gregormendelii TaxID=1628277 RepID=A0ABS3AKV7_9PSED|nr:hypothetical protein [Pseudomonas gregormendelii]MBN3967547.1 hypothetical protein [Pseudomonas gregormendelii]